MEALEGELTAIKEASEVRVKELEAQRDEQAALSLITIAELKSKVAMMQVTSRWRPDTDGVPHSGDGVPRGCAGVPPACIGAPLVLTATSHLWLACAG